MFGYDGEVNEVVVSAIFHVMGVSFRAIVALTDMCFLNGIVIMERSNSTDDEYYLAVAFMSVQP